jgi:hypothetical protein
VDSGAQLREHGEALPEVVSTFDEQPRAPDAPSNQILGHRRTCPSLGGQTWTRALRF